MDKLSSFRKINADNFEIKTNLLQLVQANPYHGFERENPHTHINNFKRITSTLKFKDVPNDVIKLMMFPYSLEGSARVWYDKEPLNSILTWDDLVNKFVNQFFTPSKTTHLNLSLHSKIRGDIWRDSLNAAAGGNLLNNTTREALQLIENKSKVRYSGNKPNVSRMNTTSRKNASKTDDRIDKLADQISTLVDIFVKKVVTPAPVKGVEESCVTCGGLHAYYNYPNTDSNQSSVCVATGTYNQVAPQNRASNYMAPPGFAPNQSSTSGTLQSNTIPNPKGEMKTITTRSGVAYEGPSILTPKKTLPKPNIPYPSRLNDKKLRENATNQMEKFFQIFQDLHFDISFEDALLLMPKFASTVKSLLMNKDKLFELAKIPLNENCSAMLLKKLPENLGDPGRSFLRTGHALIDVYGEEITLRVNDEAVTFNLNKTTRYSSTYDDLSVNRIDIINVAREEYAQEILGYSNNSTGGNSISTSEPILSDSSPSLTPFEGSDFILEEIEGSWVSPIHSVPKKGGITVVENENNELIPTRLVTGWRVCIDYRKLNDATRKDHFPLPFMDQMLERLARNKFYCFLDGFSGYFQLPINPPNQEKTTFTCPYETFAYCRMPFVLCNAPGTFQKCMVAIFHDMIEKTMEVFMDDFLVFGDSFSSCLSYLYTMLQRCEDTNLVLNWEKCHFMVKEGIVLGHKISKNGLEVGRAKFDVIAKLPYPTTVKGVRSFLGHAGFYRRFIQDFSKIARHMTHLLEKETPFVFFKDCIDAFETLKKKLTEAPILVVPDWNLPFELMCYASDFAIDVVLGHRKTKHFQPIHYASKTMTEAQIHYTTTEKEMLAVIAPMGSLPTRI
nr:reverse transcriptase domain-containing protein [Tanacetum cinerariifolium]